ncbi:S-layer homology domain-containing protein [Alkalihalophilus marmarensis]|uniref:Transglycosylase SLT domain-containing protein n=1 Tax=Alkalihalophilus marmarensis DSM 21297 TaxID=1188261 RepID=U6STB1_9BACI|nr:S-layer homology domain-containing protein [Alkalihalophilus marmarensis]ERN54622.1 hypothetical protein A33I_04565 [Alkalihalophilus marmarensis DSM 21297]MCM3488840.1 S-layer homology domain-containing protein [Alkalihalophilus marmarensis]
MKKLVKNGLFTFGFIGLLSMNLPTTVLAAETVAERCQYEAVVGVNPAFQTTNCLLTEMALDYNIPPEVVKAVAERESSWVQFNSDGTPNISSDNGIGMMQLTNQAAFDQERLETDVLYNIEAGVKVLDEMFTRGNLPVINDNDRDVIESWYFAVMAYNGIKPQNSPVRQASGERNESAYQELVYSLINRSEQGTTTKQLSFKPSDFNYDPTSDANIEFPVGQFTFDDLTKTKYLFDVGQKVETNTRANFRTSPSTQNNLITTLPAGEVLTITGSFTYDVVSPQNQFVWYPVKRTDGTEGYITSGNLNPLSDEGVEPAPPVEPEEPVTFSDVPSGHWAEKEISYLTSKGIINGYPNGKFGLNDNITRWQAAIILVNANGGIISNPADPGFEDISSNYQYYNVIATAVEKGLFAGPDQKSNTFRPTDTLSRAEMAVLLQRLYKFPNVGEAHPFRDVIPGSWYAASVNNIYHAGVAAGDTTYNPQENVTRAQFATFMARAMEDSFRLK